MPAPPASPSDSADAALPAALLDFLRSTADETDRLNRWPGEQLRRCAEAGVTRWFAPPELGGVVVAQADVLRRLTHLAAACLTTTFCLTQPTGVIGRIAACDNDELKATLIPELLSGRRYASVGIAHLTTSRRHTQPVMTARETDDGYILDGVIPWSTGAQHSAWIVTGAVLADGRQLLASLPTDLPGVTVEPPAEMVGLSATCTGAVRCDGVLLDRRWLMAPVMSDVLKFGKGAGRAANVGPGARHGARRHRLSAWRSGSAARLDADRRRTARAMEHSRCGTRGLGRRSDRVDERSVASPRE
jgi:alkylation response protein AidB-like acyl-CoA dehydrogenase